MILIPKYKDMRTKTPLEIEMGIKGEIRLILRNPDESVVQDTGWFHNLFTDVGMTNIGIAVAGGWSNYFHIGQSSAAPAFNQTQLAAWSGSDNSIIDNQKTNAGTPNYEIIETVGKRFEIGNGTGPVREVGIGAVATNDNLSVRALVTPEINKGAEQVLDMFYRITAIPSLIDTVGVVSIFGADYDYILRLSEVESNISNFGTWGPTGWAPTYEDDIGLVTSRPTTIISGTSTVLQDQSSGLGFSDWTVPYGLGQGNAVGGIRSALSQFNFATGTTYAGVQAQFNRVSDDAKIEKNNTRTLAIDWRLSWTRV